VKRIFGRFGCDDCGATFHAQHGAAPGLEELRCERCDESVLVERNGAVLENRPCAKCDGTMKAGLEPMCPRCNSRSVKFLIPGMFFD
jgi:hypothetical protein